MSDSEFNHLCEIIRELKEIYADFPIRKCYKAIQRLVMNSDWLIVQGEYLGKVTKSPWIETIKHIEPG